MTEVDMSGVVAMPIERQRNLLALRKAGPVRLVNVTDSLRANLELTRIADLMEIEGIARAPVKRKTAILWSEVITADADETLHPTAFRWLRAGIVFAGATMLMLGIDALLGVI